MGRHVKADRVIDPADRPNVFKAHVLWKRHAGCLVGIDPYDENIGLLGRKFQ